MRDWLRGLVQAEIFRTDPLFDGTLSDLSNALYLDNALKPERYLDQLEPASDARFGYVQLRVSDFRSRSIDDYAEVVDDPELWTTFESEVMGRYFNDHIELFPFHRREFADLKRRNDDGMAFVNPEAFHLVQKEMIERRFSGGQPEEIGERDLREAIAAFRYAFVQNFWRLVMSRRGTAAIGILLNAAILLVVGAFLVMRSGAPTFFLELSAVGLLSAAAIFTTVRRTRHMITRLTGGYEDAIRASCNVLSSHLRIRVQSLTEIIPLIFHRIDRSKWQMLTDGRLEDWPMEVRKWSKLAFWLSARVEHIELLMQVQMWRVRRLHFGIRWLGRLLSGALGGFALLTSALAGGLGLLGLSTAGPMLGDGQALTALAVLVATTCVTLAVSLLLASLSFRYSTPDLDIIRNTLKTDSMRRFRDVKLHREFAEHVREQKQSQVYNESLLKR